MNYLKKSNHFSDPEELITSEGFEKLCERLESDDPLLWKKMDYFSDLRYSMIKDMIDSVIKKRLGKEEDTDAAGKVANLPGFKTEEEIKQMQQEAGKKVEEPPKHGTEYYKKSRRDGYGRLLDGPPPDKKK